MTISKTENGTYRIREMINGKRYSVTVKEKPTKKEAEMLIHAKIGIEKDAKRHSRTFYDCAYDYIELKSNVISPTTIRTYRSMLTKSISSEFSSIEIDDITQADIQKEINMYAANHAPKTVRNMNGFISAVFATFRPSMQICTTLPQKAKYEPYIPTDNDVKRILEYAKGSEYELLFKVCAMAGLRRSEAIALTSEDVDGNVLIINKAKVIDENNKIVEKQTKTTSSTRRIQIPQQLADEIKEAGAVYTGYPNSPHRYLKRALRDLNIPDFSLHKFRYYYISSAHAIGIPDQYIMQASGHKTDHTLKQVYRKAMQDKSDNMQRKIADSMSALY